MKIKSALPYILAIILIAFLMIVILGFFFVWKDNQKQKDELSELKNDIAIIQNEINSLKKDNENNNDNGDGKDKGDIIQIYNYEPEYLTDSYNILAIGNCITRNNNSEYSPYEYGLGASCFENDYLHKLGEMSFNSKKNVYVYPLNYSVWEMTDTGRSALLGQLDTYLDEKLDLIVIQLGENILNTDSFETDYSNLIEYVKGKAPNAQIVIVDDFWDDEKSKIKERIAKNNGVLFASLKEIKNDKQYQCGIGYVTNFVDGSSFSIQNEGAAEYPNDKGMAYIAKEIINLLNTEK